MKENNVGDLGRQFRWANSPHKLHWLIFLTSYDFSTIDSQKPISDYLYEQTQQSSP